MVASPASPANSHVQPLDRSAGKSPTATGVHADAISTQFRESVVPIGKIGDITKLHGSGWRVFRRGHIMFATRRQVHPSHALHRSSVAFRQLRYTRPLWRFSQSYIRPLQRPPASARSRAGPAASCEHRRG